MPRSPQPLQQIIASDTTLAVWQARRDGEEALTRLVRQHLPRQLGERTRATQRDGGEVELIVAAGAVAAALRQRVPDLAVALQREGWTCSGIRVRVQVSTSVAPDKKNIPAPVDKSSLAALATLTRSLDDGPLKNALGRLLRRVGETAGWTIGYIVVK